MIIDHIGLSVSDVEKSKEFYTKSLAPLGIVCVMEAEGWVGFGKQGKPEFWFGVDGNLQRPMHVAFSADSQEQVNQFYVATISAGAKDNGKPGLREIYHPGYYGAFVIDPDGHNIEAVFHGK